MSHSEPIEIVDDELDPDAVPAQIREFIREFPQHTRVMIDLLQFAKRPVAAPGSLLHQSQSNPASSVPPPSSTKHYHRPPTLNPSQLYAPPTLQGAQPHLPTTVNAAEQAQYLNDLTIEELESLKQYWEDSARHSSKVIAYCTYWLENSIDPYDLEQQDVMMTMPPAPPTSHHQTGPYAPSGGIFQVEEDLMYETASRAHHHHGQYYSSR
eukprot:TRINITY_DN6200_c0_g1_i1.p1 TRINITY_DN6200_c0_g1~~TRINITY_DN6200_c0_g1_i1.p1  ORF type:complete len:210 (+),score=31.61 TRINITY_DN6200_c0_g1_i1:343-972(+)